MSRRRPAERSTRLQLPSARPATDLLTYRFKGKMVFVVPPTSFQNALDVAITEYNDELANVSRDRIGFAVTSMGEEGKPEYVRISEAAWPSAIRGLASGTVVDIYLRPDPNATDPLNNGAVDLPPIKWNHTSLLPPTDHHRSQPGSRSSSKTRSSSLTRKLSWFS